MLRPLGSTRQLVSPLGLGAGPLGDGRLSDTDAERLLNRALDEGLRLIDTAPSYGTSEQRIGRVARQRRDEMVLSTKLGYGIPGIADWTGPCIEAGVDRALRIFGVERIDIAHLHSCPIEVLREGEVTAALLRAVDAGKVRAAAYSGEGDALDVAIESGAFSVVQASCSILDPAARGLRAARERGLGTIAKRPLANAPWQDPDPQSPDRVTYRRRFERLALPDLGIARSELFLRYAAFHPAIDCAIAGTTSLERLIANARSVQRGPLPEEVLRVIADAHARADALTWPGVI